MTSKLFIPTYLYIKQHSATGKLYFGKTTKPNPEKYLGSGVHWKRHINTHGKEHVVTIWYCLFLDQTSCTEFALNFSAQQNIVESTEWLNLKPENGLDGGPMKHSDGAKLKISKAQLGNKNMLGRIMSDEQKHKRRIAQLGISKPQQHVKCPHCEKFGGVSIMNRWHFDNCQYKHN